MTASLAPLAPMPPALPCSSAVAFGKLHGVLPSKPLSLPGKNAINLGLAAGNLAAGAAFIGSGTADAATGIAALCEHEQWGLGFLLPGPAACILLAFRAVRRLVLGGAGRPRSV